MRLYELPRGQGIQIKVDDVWLVFDHVDGMYSYCWRKDDRSHIVHLAAYTELKEYGRPSARKYEVIDEVRLPPENAL